MGLVVRLPGAAVLLVGTAGLVRLLLRNPEGVLPVAVVAWCLLILTLTVLFVIRGGWAATGEKSLLRFLAFGRAFVLLYGFVFVGGLILVIVAFVML